MKNKLLLLLLLLSINLYAQSPTKLDEKFGINKFKLESSIDEYMKDIDYVKGRDNDYVIYSYNGNDFTELYGAKIQAVSLGFYKRKLYKISINFTPLKEGQEIAIRENIQMLFGSPAAGNLEDAWGKYKWKDIYETKKVNLTLYKTDTPFTNIIHLELYSILIHLQRINDGF